MAKNNYHFFSSILQTAQRSAIGASIVDFTIELLTRKYSCAKMSRNRMASSLGLTEELPLQERA